MVYVKPETTLKVVDALRKAAVKNLYVSINTPLKDYKADIIKNNDVINIIKGINRSCIFSINNNFISFR